jgi:hypothetical protein
MRYQRVEWRHDYADEPRVLFAEIDDQGWETRKVDEFPDGTVDRAGPDEETERTALSESPIPSMDQINEDPQFVAEAITAAAFESVWSQAGAQAAPGDINER